MASIGLQSLPSLPTGKASCQNFGMIKMILFCRNICTHIHMIYTCGLRVPDELLLIAKGKQMGAIQGRHSPAFVLQ